MSTRGRGRGRGKAISEETAETLPKINKKKQFPVVAVITPDGIQGNLLSARRPLIVHLPIQSKDVTVTNMPVIYDPQPPMEAEPYDSHADNLFYETIQAVESHASENVICMMESAKVEVEPAKPASDVTHDIDFYQLKSSLLVQFKDSAEIKKIPDHSDAACFWCCFPFTNRPVVLPIRDTGEYLQVTGNFCSPECATSYLFDIRQDYHTRWEQFALLYRIYHEACQGKIHPAPPRSVLKHFGGPLTIQEYRKLIRSHQYRIDVHLPPMVSILATMDTKPIDFYDSNLTKNVNETVNERLQKAEEVLRLRRTKPLKAWESTLDACINLKIRS